MLNLECDMSRFLSKEEYPQYYHAVNVLILLAGRDWLVDRAWLAVNDDGRYIWTIDGTDKVLLDDEVIDWWNE